MTSQRFTHTQYPVASLIAQIKSGSLSLPDLQRPFVWKRARVRELFDSLYRGYPAGYFLFWSTPAAVDSHQVQGADGNQAANKMIVDGQQRLTSLFSVMTGASITTGENSEPITLSFNPLTEEFAVADATKQHDPEWVADVSVLWAAEPGMYELTNSFLARLEADRELSDADRRNIGNRLARLHALEQYQFSALDLSGELDIDEVADVFVRINSQGVGLNSADFILTLMSVYRKEARHRFEDFCREALKPTTSKSSPFNHFHAPSPDEMLRVAVGVGLDRGVLQNAYQLLRGRDPKTQVVSEEFRDEQFAKLLVAQDLVLDLTNWHDYLASVKRAGYRSGDMLTSKNNFLYCYLFFILGRHRFGVGQSELREAIARWFFMASLTGRYTGSPETALESDLRRFGEVSSAEEFVSVIDQTIATQLTKDFWTFTLPDLLDSSAAWSPYLFSYYAALNLLDATALFSQMKITSLFDPGVRGTRSAVERHHLFPKGFLSKSGLTGSSRQNHLANYAFVEWGDNADIGDRAPAEYFPPMFDRLSGAAQKNARFWHALPPDWENMDFPMFLAERRKLLADVVRRGFEQLRDGRYDQPVTGRSALPSVADLLRQMETNRVEFKKSARAALESEVPEKVINDGVIKTVAAFLNTGGGTLAVGISDDGDIVGVQPDLDMKRHDLDQYQNWLTTLLMATLGDAVVSSFVGVRFETVGAHVVTLVDVEPSTRAVYAKTTKGDDCFYVRVNNTTRQLAGQEMVEYIKHHWS